MIIQTLVMKLIKNDFNIYGRKHSNLRQLLSIQPLDWSHTVTGSNVAGREFSKYVCLVNLLGVFDDIPLNMC